MKPVSNIKTDLQNARKMSTTEKSLRFIVILGNFFGLFPVSGDMSQEKGFSFNWKSLKVQYSCLIMVVAFCTLIVGVVYLPERSTFLLVGKSKN